MNRLFTFSLLAGALIFAICMFSCGGDDGGNDDPEPNPQPQPQDTCQTANITYKNYVENLVSRECVACHNTTRSEAGLVLETYEEVQAIAADGKFMNAVKGANDFSIMPPAPAPELDSCAIEKLQAWIDDQTPEE